MCDLVPAFAARDVPVLGVCLGHQAIGQVYGATVVGAATLMHGKTSEITHDGTGVFAGLPSPLTGTRYHSLTLAPDTIPSDLVVTATADDGTVMGVRHRHHRVEGVQFHPESILTGCGHELLANFLSELRASPHSTEGCQGDGTSDWHASVRRRQPRPAARSGSRTRLASSADSTPSATTTSMIERPLAWACLTIAAARS